MNQPVILISALKYSPIHGTLSRAYGEPLRSEGWHVRYLFSNRLAWTLPNPDSADIDYFGTSGNIAELLWDTGRLTSWKRPEIYRLMNKWNPAVLLFESSHPGNRIIAAIARTIRPEVQIWLLFHEPYVTEKKRHGSIRSLIIAAHEWSSRRLVPSLDGILVPSNEAREQFMRGYPGFQGKVVCVPLLFEDRWRDIAVERRFYTFVGHAVPAKGIDVFLRMISRAIELRKAYSFQIVTSTDISGYLRKMPSAARAVLKVICKPKLQNEEIDQAIRESWAVLAPYKRVTQSGVVPVAYMNETPVISTRIGGMPETILPGRTGYLIDENAPFYDWYAAFEKARENSAMLGAKCRAYFLGNFDSRLAPRVLRPVLDGVP